MHEHYYMERCLQLAALGKGHVAPNPMVGAVLVHEGHIIGEGWHKAYGQAHAEVNCLNSVAEADKDLVPGSTMYVSLEPCAHYGKTPPCALRLIEERVKEVVICNVDPYAEVGGKGINMLREKDIVVRTGLLQQQGLWLNRRFFCFHTQKRPYIILKWAQTSEGFFAPTDNSRLQMSNAHSKQLLHKWRTEEAAIMVGTNTALADDPKLTAREWQGKQPLRIVLDKHLALPGTLRLFDSAANTWIVNEQEEKQVGNVSYIKLVFDDNMLKGLMQRLHEANILSLIVEGGATLLERFIDASMWDEARVFHTQSVLQEGLLAPVLRSFNKVLSAYLDTDTLNIYIRNGNPYHYIAGMDI